MNDLNDLNEVQSIDNEIAALQAKKKELLDAKRTGALEQAKTLVRTFGFTAQELELVSPIQASTASAGPGKKTGKREPIYRNVNNPDETWAGGAKPKWVQAFEANGGDVETCRIKR